MCASVLDAMLYSDSDCSDFLGKGTARERQRKWRRWLAAGAGAQVLGCGQLSIS